MRDLEDEHYLGLQHATSVDNETRSWFGWIWSLVCLTFIFVGTWGSYKQKSATTGINIRCSLRTRVFHCAYGRRMCYHTFSFRQASMRNVDFRANSTTSNPSPRILVPSSITTPFYDCRCSSVGVRRYDRIRSKIRNRSTGDGRKIGDVSSTFRRHFLWNVINIFMSDILWLVSICHVRSLISKIIICGIIGFRLRSRLIKLGGFFHEAFESINEIMYICDWNFE